MKAAIDIGTNTVLLLVAEKAGNGLKVMEEQQRVPRLGRGVDNDRILTSESIDRVIKVLKEYKGILDDKYPDVGPPVVTATSAVRDAGNRSTFVRRVKEQTGFKVVILSGTEEAEHTFWGAQSVLKIHAAHSATVVLDIGGGSTEIAVGKNGELTDAHSFDMGCVRFTERFLDRGYSSAKQITACRNAVKETLEEHPFEMSPKSTLIGVAGTATSAAYIRQEMTQYDPDKINGYQLTIGQLDQFIAYISNRSPDRLRQQYPVVMEGRADIFLAGLLIMKGVMTEYGFNSLTISTGGIRHGAIMLMS